MALLLCVFLEFGKGCLPCETFEIVCGEPEAARRHPVPLGIVSELDIQNSKLKITAMSLPYKIATLLYCFNEAGEILLLERAQEPNRGFWSPCGGKLHTDEGESPYACACREAHEELGIALLPRDLHLT